MEQELLKYIGIYKFPSGKEPSFLVSNDFYFKVKSLYKEGQNLMFEGTFKSGDRGSGYFSILNEEKQKVIYDRFNELN